MIGTPRVDAQECFINGRYYITALLARELEFEIADLRDQLRRQSKLDQDYYEELYTKNAALKAALYAAQKEAKP